MKNIQSFAEDGWETPECAWCGAEVDESEPLIANRRHELFCSKAHRTASNKALRDLRENQGKS